MKTKSGMTLIELMIVIAIMSILAAVAFSIYNHYIRTAFEVDPVGILLRASLAEEKYYADHYRYAENIEDLTGFNDGSRDNKFIINPSGDNRRKFKLYVETANETYYKIVIENFADENSKWKIRWHIECSSTADVSKCKPKQDKGSSLLKNVF